MRSGSRKGPPWATSSSSGSVIAGSPPASTSASRRTSISVTRPLRDREELAAHLGIALVVPTPERRGRARALLPDASHLRAQVGGLEMNGHAVRIHDLVQMVGDLLPEPLLHGESARVDTDEPR